MAGQYESRMLRVMDYIHKNPAGDLSLDQLADIAAMSRFHWHRVFHAMTGETCAQAVRRIRLHLAACRLVQTTDPIALIARDVGYPHVPSFMRAFSETYALPPGAFRSRGALTAPMVAQPTGETTMFPIDIATQPARRLAALAHQGAYTEIGQAFEQTAAIFTARDLWHNTGGMIGVYYDDPDATPSDQLRSHAGVVIPADAPIAPPLEEVTLPQGRYAVMHFKGPYAGLPAAYQYLYGSWLPQSGEEVGDHPPIEVYLNQPQNVAPDDLLTDVCLPLK